MGVGEITHHIDFAQACLYVFWAFFFFLIFFIRREDRREGYPLENDENGWVWRKGFVFFPAPKTFKLANDKGTYQAPNDDQRDTREIKAERAAPGPGSAYEPTGNPMKDGLGPAAWAQREDEPELTYHGEKMIVPMRIAEGFRVARNSQDPRGMDVVGLDGESAGTVKDIWVDRSDQLIVFLEVELHEGAGTRLLPMSAARLTWDLNPNHIMVKSIKAEHFKDVPQLKHPDEVTSLEEDKIMAYYAGGHLYAEESRFGPLF